MTSTTISLDELDNGPLRDRLESLPYTEDAKQQVERELNRVSIVIEAHVLTGDALDYWHERSAMLEVNLADFGITPRPLKPSVWAALEAAEKPLYGTHEHSYTDVNVREESGGTHIAAMWAHAEEGILNIAEHDADEDNIRAEIAERVAIANAVLVFGAEFVGIGSTDVKLGGRVRIDGETYKLDQRTSNDPLGVGRDDGDRYILRPADERFPYGEHGTFYRVLDFTGYGADFRTAAAAIEHGATQFTSEFVTVTVAERVRDDEGEREIRRWNLTNPLAQEGR